MDLIMFSGCIKSLDYDLMTTSSEKFEYEFALNLMLHEKIKIIIYSEALDYGETDTKICLKLIGVRGRDKYNTYKNLEKLLRDEEEIGKIAICYGYDLFGIIEKIRIKFKYKIKIVCFIFDTHIPAIQKYSRMKKLIASIYFGIAIKLLNVLDGCILFQIDAAKELKLRKPYHVTKPGIDKLKIKSYIYDRSTEKFTITYMGSLMHYNGINEMLDGFAMCQDINLRLRIFGSGYLEKEVIEYAKKDKRVYYGGLIDQKEINQELKKTDLLLNLRDPTDYVCKFAYPSKLIEYMATGIPILSTDLKFSDDMKASLYTIKSLNAVEIYQKIQFIKRDTQTNKIIKVEKAKEYIAKNNSWENICKGIMMYLKEKFNP